MPVRITITYCSAIDISVEISNEIERLDYEMIEIVSIKVDL